MGERWLGTGSLVLGSRTAENESGTVDLRVWDLAWDYADYLPGRPFAAILARFREHGLGWDDVDPGTLFQSFNPRHLNMYHTTEAGNPRLGFFGGANPIANREAAVSGMPLRALFAGHSRSVADAVAEQVVRVAATGMPLLQYVRIEHRQLFYHRLMLPAAGPSDMPTKVLAFALPVGIFLGTSLLRPPPGATYN